MTTNKENLKVGDLVHGGGMLGVVIGMGEYFFFSHSSGKKERLMRVKWYCYSDDSDEGNGRDNKKNIFQDYWGEYLEDFFR